MDESKEEKKGDDGDGFISGSVSKRSKTEKKTSMKHSYSTPSLSTIKKLREVEQLRESNDFPTAVYDYIQLSNVRDFIRADIPLTKNSFQLCPHKHHCAQNAIFKGFFRTFAATYVFKTSIVLATQLFGGKIIKYNKNKLLKLDFNFSKLENIYYSVDSIQFAQFVGLMSFTYKALLCTFRRILNRDPTYHKTIAGFIAALWVIRDNKDRRNTLALYCFVRAMGDWIKLLTYKKPKTSLKNTAHNNNTVHNSNSKSKSGPKPSKTSKTTKTANTGETDEMEDDEDTRLINGEVVTFTAAQMVIMWAFAHAPHMMNKAYYKWIKNMGNLTEYQIQYVYRSPSDHTKMYKLDSEPFIQCNPIFHKYESCFLSNFEDLLRVFAWRASRMYFYVHFLPIILFTPKKFFNKPIYYTKLKLYNTFRSSLFLAFYVFNMKHTQCILRNYLKCDPWWVAALGGLMSGLSVIIEHRKRRTELCLYVIPRAIEIVFRIISKQSKFCKKILKSFWLPIVSFAMAISAWMTLMATKNGLNAANGLNMTVLQVIFGTNH